jgi:hypothetical protein
VCNNRNNVGRGVLYVVHSEAIQKVRQLRVRIASGQILTARDVRSSPYESTVSQSVAAMSSCDIVAHISIEA